MKKQINLTLLKNWMQKLRDIPLQGKMSLIYICANLLVLVVNIILLLGINTMIKQMDMVYQKNRELNELSNQLEAVQESMTAYLSVKTSDSLSEYFRSVEQFNQTVSELSDEISDASLENLERNIKHLSENYLEMAAQTIEAKRGRNIEKYRTRYEKASSIYNYINTYIDSLNDEQFRISSQNYDELSLNFRVFEWMSVCIIISVAMLNVVLILILTGTIISPLKTLASLADEVAKGNFDIDLVKARSKDEIGIVTGAFNQMVVNIREYIEKLRQSMEVEQALREKELKMETHLKDAQLKYLQAQINPHFLFNTLNAGAQLAMMEEADRTYDYIQNMAEFFRYNVRKGDSVVTIGEELEQIDHYIYILNVRFSGEIGYEKDVDRNLLDLEMPGMILQPIIENCVNHGIREMEGKGKILLRVYRQDDMVCISIKDNGTGMSQEMIDRIMSGEIKEKPPKPGGNGIGMDNVIARLRLFEDNDTAVEIFSEGEGKGTEFIIYLEDKG